MYYSGSSSYTSAPYSYSSSVSPYGSSYSAAYLSPGGNYSSHSSLGVYSRTPLTSRWLSSGGRAYSPMLSTISEKGTLTPVRINSPRRTPITNRNYVPSQYSHRPININTADIDVSRDKYRYKKTNTNQELLTKLPPRNDSPKTNKETGHDKPHTGIDSSPGRKRTTIKRDRPVVRLHTVKRKERDSPRKPIETVQSDDSSDTKKLEEQTETIKWRQKLADDLSYKTQKEKKTLGAKLVEKFTLKDRQDDHALTKKESPTREIVSENISDANTINANDSLDKFNRRCSVELLAEQANLLDSLIRRENLSTVPLDLSKIGTKEEPTTKTQIKSTTKSKISGKENPLTTTKSDQSLHDRLLEKSFKDKKHSKKRNLRKCSSGGSICKLDSITELPKNIVPSNSCNVEEIVLIENKREKVKPKLKAKITATVEITTPPSPLKFVVGNVTVEEKPRPVKKDIIFSSTVDEIRPPDKSVEIQKDNMQNQSLQIEIDSMDNTNNKPITSSNLIGDKDYSKSNNTSGKFSKGHRKSVKSKPSVETSEDLTSLEAEDGNFWDKIGKRETVYLIKRKQNIEDTQVKLKRSLFWFPGEEEESDFFDAEAIDDNKKEEDIKNTTKGIEEESDLNVKELSIHKNVLQDNNTKLSTIHDKNALKNEPLGNKSSKAELNDLDKMQDNSKCEQSNKNNVNKVDQICDNLNNKKFDIKNLKTKMDKGKVDNTKTEINNKKELISPDIFKQEQQNDDSEENQKGSEKYKKFDYSKVQNTCLPSVETNSTEKVTKSEVYEISTSNKNINNSESSKIDAKKKSDLVQTNLKGKSEKENNKQITNELLVKSISQENTCNDKVDLSLPITSISLKTENMVEHIEIKEQPNNNIVLERKSIINDNSNNITEPLKSTSDAVDGFSEEDKVNITNLQYPSYQDLTSEKKETEAIINEGNKSPDLLSSEEQNTHVNECSSSIINIPDIEVQAKNSTKNINIDSKITENKEDIPAEKNKIIPPKQVKAEKSPLILIATPRPLQKRGPQVIRSSSSSEDSEDSSDEEEESDSSEEGTTEFFECESNADGRTSTGSNDSGFDSSAPTSPSSFLQVKKDCDVNCHRKCEKLTANLCGVNQRLLVEALATRTTSKKGADSPSTSTSPATSQTNNFDISEKELEHSTAYDLFRKTGRFTPPARTIPRFRKYTIDDFQFIRVLGKGSFGKVMLAELRDTEYYYAVKCLKKDVVLEDDDVECTLIERKVLALGTNHPYLCHLFATFQTDSHLFFVMEYLNGGDLMFHIQQSGRFPEARARLYAAEIVSGLKFLHKRGIVYRDLKLDNILLDFDGHVRIADFGMCKLQIYLDKTADTFCGTPDYMAPEIIKGLKYNQTVDWWSFGVLLYEMLIGQSPFSGCDEDELFWSICNEMPSYPRFLSKEALSILTRLLDKDAKSRLGGAECMFGDVRDQDFFRPINWERLEHRELEAPFKPRVRHPMDTQYFDRAFTGERPRLTTVEPQVLRSMDQEPFRGFSYTNPNATDR